MTAFQATERMTSPSERNVVLDGMRGIAALMVMALHYTDKNGALTFGHIDLFGSSYLAVDLFFVLSGFVIYKSYAGALAGKMTAQDYVLRRLIRLYPMFLLGASIGFVSLIVTANDTSALPKGLIFRDFSFNLLGLPCPNVDGIYPFGASSPTIGELYPTNPPSWSLFFELFASLAFPFVFRLDEKWMVWIMGSALAALLACGYAVSLPSGRLGPELALGWGTSNFLAGFPRVVFSFAAGIVICRRFMRAAQNAVFGPYGNRAALALYGVVVVCLMAPNLSGGYYELLFIALISPALVTVAANVHISNGILSKISDFLGWLSYPLYCVHYPVGRLVWHLSHARGLSNSASAGASVLISVGVAILAGAFFDEPVRRTLSALFLRRRVIAFPAQQGVRQRVRDAAV